MSKSYKCPAKITFVVKKGKTLYPNPDELSNKLKRVYNNNEGIYLSLFLLSLTRIAEDDDDEERRKRARCFSPPRTPIYTPTDDLSSFSEEEEPKTFEEAFFGRDRVPFGIEPTKDAFLLDREWRGVDFLEEAEQRYFDAENAFARNIYTYDDGAVVTRHCEPWGDLNVLFTTEFTIEKRVYSANHSQPRFVHIREVIEPHREFCLEAPFFSGWLDEEGKKLAHNFMRRK